MKKIRHYNTLLKLLVINLCVLAFTGCSTDSDEIEDKHTFTDIITYKILPRDEAVALFIHEPLHSQITPLFLDITQKKKGVLYDEWLEVAKNSIISPTAEKQRFMDIIAVEQTAMMKALGIKLPIEKETKYIDMPMQDTFDGMAAFTSGSHIYADLDLLVDERYKDWTSMVAWHEMWHVISRNNPELRKQMYSLLSFTVLPLEIEIPDEVRAHILCNPDVERHDSYATFTIEGKPTDCMLMLYTPASEYIEGTSLKDYVGGTDGYWLLALDKDTHKPYRGEDGKWVIYNCTEASDFNKVMSNGNTSYCDDPEECMADNFAYAMLSDTTLPNQKLLQDIRTLLKNYCKGR